MNITFKQNNNNEKTKIQLSLILIKLFSSLCINGFCIYSITIQKYVTIDNNNLVMLFIGLFFGETIWFAHILRPIERYFEQFENLFIKCHHKSLLASQLI